MRLREQLDAIGSERLISATRVPGGAMTIRTLVWAVLALHRLDPKAVWMFCVDNHIDVSNHAGQAGQMDALIARFETGDAAKQSTLLAALMEMTQRVRSALSQDITNAPAERHWRRDQDLSDKVQAAFSMKREKQMEGKRESLPLYFRKGNLSVLMEFRTPGAVLSEYHDPHGAIRSRGFGQKHFIDALDTHLKNERFWIDIYEQESPVGWWQEDRRGDDGITRYRPAAAQT